MKIKHLQIILASCFALMQMDGSGQGNIPSVSSEGYSIDWAGQYPDLDGQKRGFFESIDHLLFGSENRADVKPVISLPDTEGNLWIFYQGTGSIVKVSKRKKKVTHIRASEGFSSIVDACLVPGVGIIFTDSSQGRIFCLNTRTGDIEQLENLPEFDRPTGIAYSENSGSLWLVETGKHCIHELSLEGKILQSLGGRGKKEGLFNFPTHICIGEEGDLYVVDAMNFRIQIFNQDGIFMASFGKAGDSSGSMARPKGIACDSFGHIYIADALFNTIQVFNRQGDLLYYFGSAGSGKGEFSMPAGLFVDEKDQIYVADSYNNRVQVFTLNSND